jgi:hypothetical protein
VKAYLAAHADELEDIAAPDPCEAGTSTTIWRCSGGWADPIDWDERVAVIGAKTHRWAEVLAGLSPQCYQWQAEENRNREKMGIFEVNDWAGTA